MAKTKDKEESDLMDSIIDEALALKSTSKEEIVETIAEVETIVEKPKEEAKANKAETTLQVDANPMPEFQDTFKVSVVNSDGSASIGTKESIKENALKQEAALVEESSEYDRNDFVLFKLPSQGDRLFSARYWAAIAQQGIVISKI